MTIIRVILVKSHDDNGFNLHDPKTYYFAKSHGYRIGSIHMTKNIVSAKSHGCTNQHINITHFKVFACGNDVRWPDAYVDTMHPPKNVNKKTKIIYSKVIANSLPTSGVTIRKLSCDTYSS